MSRASSSVDPSLQQWQSFIQTCRTLPSSDTLKLSKLDTVYPVKNGHNAYPKAQEREWAERGEQWLGEFEREAERSEEQYRILIKAGEQLQELINMRGGGTDGGGAKTPVVPDIPKSTVNSRKRKASPPHSLRLADLASNGGGASSSRASPSVYGGSSYPASTRSMSPMPSSGTHTSAGRDWSKRRKEAQLPLRIGRKVLYKPSAKSAGAGAGGAPAGGQPEVEEHMLFRVESMIAGNKERYWIVDIDNSQTSAPRYNVAFRSLGLLPDTEAPPGSPSHPNAYEDFPLNLTVLALYPDTTAFYRATVVSAPIPGTACGRGVTGDPGKGAKAGKYMLQFDDDEPRALEVSFDMVFDFPEAKNK